MRMKNLILATTLLAVSASQASALSCIRPDVTDAFKTASASDLTYFVVHGGFQFTPPPKSDAPETKTVEADFSGRLLTGAGFTQEVAAPITINMTCEASWCAEIEPEAEYIAFIEQQDDALVFRVGPCYGLAFKDPALDDVKRLENCAQGGACEASTN